MIRKNCVSLITWCECKLCLQYTIFKLPGRNTASHGHERWQLLFLAVLIKMSKFLSSKVWFSFHLHQQMHRKHQSALVCSQSENAAHKELLQSLTGKSGKISLVIPLFYTPGLPRLPLKMWNYQLLSEEIQALSTHCAPGHIQSTFGCMWTRILFRKRTDVTKSTLKHEVGLLAAWWQWAACCACVMCLFTAAHSIRRIALCDLDFLIYLFFFFWKKIKPAKQNHRGSRVCLQMGSAMGGVWGV